jgi:hypothetical protein
MSFILVPNEGEDIKVNAWNWRPTIRLLHDASLIDAATHEAMGIHGMRGAVTREDAIRIAEFLEERLARMKPGDRLRADLVITSEAKRPMVFKPNSQVDDFDANDVYSATYEWLTAFAAFARASGGFRTS